MAESISAEKAEEAMAEWAVLGRPERSGMQIPTGENGALCSKRHHSSALRPERERERYGGRKREGQREREKWREREKKGNIQSDLNTYSKAGPF